MSSYERTAIQAIIGQKLDGQFQKILSDFERPIQRQLFAVKQLCAKAEKLSPDLSTKSSVTPRQSEDLAYVYTCAEQDFNDKAETHRFTRKALQAGQLQYGYVCTEGQHSTLMSVLMLVGVALGEAFVNAAFFSNAHMVASPAAAILTSCLISMTNVAASTCAGFFIGRYLNFGVNALGADEGEFSRIRKRAKWQFIAFLVAIGFLHLTVGLVRAQETIYHVVHSPAAYWHMLQTPEAVFLILMGVCMSVLAFHKGVNSFDCPYPQIGRLQTAERNAKQDIQDTIEDYESEIVDYFDDGAKELEAPVSTEERQVKQYNKAVSACHEARRKLEQVVRQYETECRGKIAELITTYGCISGEEQLVPPDALQQMVSFEKYLDVEIPAFRSSPAVGEHLADLQLEKNRAVYRLTSLYQNAFRPTGGQS